MSDFWDDSSRQASFLDLWEEPVIVVVVVTLLVMPDQVVVPQKRLYHRVWCGGSLNSLNGYYQVLNLLEK